MAKTNTLFIPLGWLALLFTSHAVSAGMIRHDVDIEAYRELGQRSEFGSVGRYAVSENVEDYAAGVLVSERWVLTASHFPEAGSVWKFGSDTYRTVRIVNHPNLDAGATERQWSGWDLALVELDRPVTGIKPAIRYRDRNEVGSRIVKIGYGNIGDGQMGMKSPVVQERLGGENIIDAAGGEVEGRSFSSDVLVFDFDDPTFPGSNRFGLASATRLEIGGSKGDSGGGVFMQVGSQWELVGIVSGALSREIRYGAMAALARVSSANEWIDQIIENRK